MLIMETPSFCTDLAPIWQIIGWVLWVFKIAVPIIIIVFGMIDLGKAVVASKDDEIKKSIKSLVMRAIAGVVIFFIPTLVGLIFRLVDGFADAEVQGEYQVCSECITSPGSCESAAAARCNSIEGRTWNSGTSTCDIAG